MPVAPTYPGVYIEEIPSGVRTIVGVATSVAAFVDFFPRGPLNRPVQLFGFGDLVREFGGLHDKSDASYGIQQFFLNGGAEAWVVRAGEPAPKAARVTLSAGSCEIYAGRKIRGESVENPGDWGEALRVEVDYDTGDHDKLFNLSISELASEAGRMVVRQTETFRNLSMDKTLPSYGEAVVNEGSQLVQFSALGADRPPATGTWGNKIPPLKIPSDKSTFSVDAGAGLKSCTLNYGGIVPSDIPHLRPHVEAAIRASDPDKNPLLAGAIVRLVGNGTSSAPYRFHILAGRGGTGFTPESKLTFSGGVTTDLGLDATPNVQQYVLENGDDGGLPNADALVGDELKKTGMYALADVDIFNILNIPRATDLPADGFFAVISKAIDYCERRRAFLIIDIPQDTNTLSEMQGWMASNDQLRHRNAAVYFPRLLIPDPLANNRLRDVGASGTMAGLYARTDAERGVWKAPAGIDARLRNVRTLAYLLTDPENGALNPLGVNCLRTFPVVGLISWGARTLAGADQLASEWKYLPVRRFALYLEESLYRGLKWVVFEPNDEPLWAQIRLNVGAFMHNLFRQGAFQGQSPKEAYLVKCDKETTTQNDIDLGIVNIVVGFAPLKPAEFVIIKIQQLAGQIQT